MEGEIYAPWYARPLPNLAAMAYTAPLPYLSVSVARPTFAQPFHLYCHTRDPQLSRPILAPHVAPNLHPSSASSKIRLQLYGRVVHPTGRAHHRCPVAWPACVGDGRAFLRDYARHGTNALRWAGLLAVTWLQLLRVATLLYL